MIHALELLACTYAGIAAWTLVLVAIAGALEKEARTDDA